MKVFDTDDAFFRPLWIRIAIVAVSGGWAVFEWRNGEAFWAGVFGAIAAYAVWSFFIVFDPRAGKDKDPGTPA